MRNTRNRKVLIIIYLLLPTLLLAQVDVSEKVQLSKTAKSNNNALYFIDFWATWCGPCVYASEYLSVLQKQNSDQFYVVSLSEENSATVKRYLKKRPTDLAVFIDYNGETFKKYSIASLPYGVLLNAKGEVVWSGSPANFKTNDLERIVKRNRSRIDLDELFVTQNNNTPKEVVTEYIPTNDFEFKELKDRSSKTLQVDDKTEYIDIKGNLGDILAYALKVHSSQIQLEFYANTQYQVYIKKNTSSYKDKIKAIIEAFNLQMTRRKINGNVLVFNIEAPTFWDTNQIDWGKNAPNYLIDDAQLQADNVSLQDIIYQLGVLLEMPVLSLTEINEEELYDWQIHYKFFTLMQSELLDSYGIQAEKKIMPFDSYIFDKKKTP